MKATGSVGKLKVGFQLAATFSWSLTYDPTQIGVPYATVNGKVDKVNKFWSTQKPLKLGLHMGGSSWWVWDAVTLLSPIEGTVELRVEGNPTAQIDF